VIPRYSKGPQTKRSAPARTTQAAAPPQLSGRRPTTAAKPIGSTRGSPSLRDQVLALPTGKKQQEIAACKGVRGNHVGMTITRHKGAGRIEERDAGGLRYALNRNRAEHRVLSRLKRVGPLRRSWERRIAHPCCAEAVLVNNETGLPTGGGHIRSALLGSGCSRPRLQKSILVRIDGGFFNGF